jgi:hypothetical protein
VLWRNWKFRSASRDAETDQERLGKVAAAIDEAIGSATRELQGLSRRREDLEFRCAVYLGNDTFEFLSRDAAESAELDQIEDMLRRAMARERALTAQIEKLTQLRGGVLEG